MTVVAKIYPLARFVACPDGQKVIRSVAEHISLHAVSSLTSASSACAERERRLMGRPTNAIAKRPIVSPVRFALDSSRVKLVQPSNAAIIAVLALTCWIPVALSAYLLAS